MVKRNDPPPIQSRIFMSPDEVDSAITKLRRRIQELEQLDVRAAELNGTGAVQVAEVMSETHYAKSSEPTHLSSMSMHT